MQCKLCRCDTKIFAKSKILSNKYEATYLECSNCHFIFIENPIWLPEAYTESITDQDIGLMNRNLRLSTLSFSLFRFFFNTKNKYLDYAGGYGVFTRLMRNLGIPFYHYDKYTKNLFAKNFSDDIENNNHSYELISAFEALEHFENPLEEISNLFKHSNSILISTELMPSNKPKPNEWHYYALDHGQHICFYSIKTFEYIAQKFSVNFYTNGSDFHLLTNKKIPKFIFKLICNFKISLFIRYIFKLPSLQDNDQKYIDNLKKNKN